MSPSLDTIVSRDGDFIQYVHPLTLTFNTSRWSKG